MPLNKSLGDFFTISSTELCILSELDCRKFGHLKLNEDANHRKRKIALKAVAFLEHALASEHDCKKRLLRKRGWLGTEQQQQLVGEEGPASEEGVLEQDEALELVHPRAYKKLGHLHLLLENYNKALSAYEKYAQLIETASEDIDYLYGTGLVYFHFNAFHLAANALQQVLYLDPCYERANDVHARLGLIRKMMKNFPASLKHFRLALRSPEACAFSEAEISFHIAHLYEVEGKSVQAIDLYMELLRSTDLPGSVRADMHTLSWRQQQLHSSIHRQLGWMHYSLDSMGEKQSRISTAIQHLQKSLELDSKSGQCLYLLGRCYASIGKVHEAFVAYRNSVDKSESNADTWCSIGVLYQQQNQPMDALQAYICAVQLEKFHGPAWTNLGMLYESTLQFHDALTCYNNAALKSKIQSPAMQQRIKFLKAQLSNIPSPSTALKTRALPSVEEAWNLPVSNEMAGRHSSNKNPKTVDVHSNKRPKVEGEGPKSLTPQQVHTLQYLQSQSNLLPQQQQLLQQLQAQYQSFKQFQIKQQMGLMRANHNDLSKGEGAELFSDEHNDMLFELPSKDLGNVSDKELEALISQQDIGSFAENLLKEIEADGASNLNMNPEGDNSEEMPSQSLSLETRLVDSKDDIKPCEVRISSLDIPTKLDFVTKSGDLSLNIKMKGEDIMRKCKNWFKSNSNGSFPLRHRPPCPPPRPPKKSLGATISKELLLPPTPSVYLENKKDAFSPQLQQFCVQHPITVVRGIAGALKLDLGLFSTKALVECNANHPIEVLTQVKQKTDENWDPTFSKQIWQCESKKSCSTLGKFGAYQTATFQDNLKEEQDKAPVFKTESEDFRNEEARRYKKSQGCLQFASCVDLSDMKFWRAQLMELMKLPSWARVVSGGNMLSHVGYPLPGSNTVSLQMSVPQCRVTAQQDSNGFCSIHINIGPGDCEWFAVPFSYWGALLALCEKNGVDFCQAAWWPNMKDLMDDEIPVFRFLQRPGDMVWVNSGCIYWVQAIGWCNSIRWNVGHLSSEQYQMAVEKYEWNKLQHVRSVVPMIHLSWNLAKNLRIVDENLFKDIKTFILETLRNYLIVKEYLKLNKIESKIQAKKKNAAVHFCSECGEEIFALLFVEEIKGDPIQCCYVCARMKNSTLGHFVCIEEYSAKELLLWFDNFQLHYQPNLSNSVNSIYGHAAISNSMLSYC